MGVFGLGNNGPPGVPAFGPAAPNSAVGVRSMRSFQSVGDDEENDEGRPWWIPLLPALIGGAVSLGQQAWQYKREDSAHQREVADLEKAGLNPALSAGGGRGAETGPPADIVGSALMVQRAKAEIDLLRSQSVSQRAGAVRDIAQAEEIKQYAGGRADLAAAQAALARGNLEQMRAQLPGLVERLREEVRLTGNRADVEASEAILRKAEQQGALNEAEIQELMRQYGPVGILLGQFLRRLSPRDLRR